MINWIKIHTVLAGFFLPAAVMFAVTGGLYTFGIKGEYVTRSETVQLSLGETPALEEVVAASRALLQSQFNADVPSGSAGIRKSGTSWQFEWTGSRADFSLEPTSAPGEFKAQLKRTSAHRFFVQLHKSKGGSAFKLMAGGLAIAFLSLFTSGVLISFGRPQLRKLLLISFALGLATFVGLAALS